jgi:hypothetical protein
MPRLVHAELPAYSEARNSQTGAGAQYHLVRNVAGTVAIIVAGIITIAENVTEANEKAASPVTVITSIGQNSRTATCA